MLRELQHFAELLFDISGLGTEIPRVDAQQWTLDNFGDSFCREGFSTTRISAQESNEALAFAYDNVIETLGTFGVLLDERTNVAFLLGP